MQSLPFFASFLCVNKERRAFLFVIFFGQSKKMTNMFAYAFTKRRMYETRKLKKGRFKEICFFGSASITKQKMNNKLLTNQSKKCYNLNKARQAVK